MLTASAIKAKARELGFDLCGIAAATDHAELKFFPEWIARGFNASMTYLEKLRRHPGGCAEGISCRADRHHDGDAV